jgi:ATP adenylyltransferase
MEHIWSPWRYAYIASLAHPSGCIFCAAARAPQSDRDNLVVYRGDLNFIILNLYPYTTGHLMVVPFEHSGSFPELDSPTTTEMMQLAKQAQVALQKEYGPDGFNIGFNLGRAAGAGVAGHIHLHVVPRWIGDANFVSIVGETRVLPEDLNTTYDKLKKHLAESEQ